MGMLLRLAHLRAREIFAEALRPLDLRTYHYGALLVLARKGPCTQRELAAALATDKSTMVRMIDDLEDRGLITRARMPSDRRAHAITLTDRGREVTARADAIAETMHDVLLAGFTDDERRTLRDLLVRLTRYDAF
ncbi:MarR family transcriptional regulator [Actinomadura logoneensis]|uniref:MarR family transcriptional regulator n=1 Tax=Actinomadura logoneensis TaxID=2293572 RepID=A0A372JQZ1_9ACTN|nr:MarR family transcriptional regulator [Actinomadura logoneensis]